jgi:hypothetical protein
MIDIKIKRIATAIDYLKSIGRVHKQQDIAEQMGATESSLSRALKGDVKYLTDKFIQRFNKAYGNIFNESWLMGGQCDMLADENEVAQQTANVESARYISEEDKTFSTMLVDMMNTKQIAPYGLLEEKDREIAELNRQIGKLEALLEVAKKGTAQQVGNAAVADVG